MGLPFFDIYIGDRVLFEKSTAEYEATKKLALGNAHIYGFPSELGDFTDEQREMLESLPHDGALVFEAPPPIFAGRLTFTLNDSPGLSKTRANFISLCTGDKGACKRIPNKNLHYVNTPVHRVQRDFVAQGGDITRGDGSGGDSIYGGKFNDEKEGLQVKLQRGALAMANSGKNSNTSQWFVVLKDLPEASLKKMQGKYVTFGTVQEGWEVLDKLNLVGTADGTPSSSAWIGECGVVPT